MIGMVTPAPSNLVSSSMLSFSKVECLSKSVPCQSFFLEKTSSMISKKSLEFNHLPVLLTEVLQYLEPAPGKVYLDCTFGGGGYSKALLEVGNTNVIAIDRDPQVQAAADTFAGDYKNRFHFHRASFGEIGDFFSTGPKFDGIVFDLGVSSPQLDIPERGFSFRFEGPLDMRMSQEGLTAAEVINTYSAERLAAIFYDYGEEKKARSVARSIVERRTTAPFKTTLDLADLVRRVVPKSKDGIDPATRVFQALRIYVNGELDQLTQALEKTLGLLNPGGRLVVVSFHSLEDRIVKRFMATYSKETHENRHSPEKASNFLPLKLLTKKPVTACLKEITTNPRARSAKLRAVELK